MKRELGQDICRHEPGVPRFADERSPKLPYQGAHAEPLALRDWGPAYFADPDAHVVVVARGRPE